MNPLSCQPTASPESTPTQTQRTMPLLMALAVLALVGCASPITRTPEAPVVTGTSPATAGKSDPLAAPSRPTMAPTVAAQASTVPAATVPTAEGSPAATTAAPKAAPVSVTGPLIASSPTPSNPGSKPKEQSATTSLIAVPAPPVIATAAVQPQAPLESVSALPTSALQPVAATQAPQELWDRIRRSFAMPDLQNDLVRQHERFYTARPEYLQRMVERSRKYLFHIVEELELRNMPTELALLPFVESAFNPQAVSTASAAGMWQFMPATGRSFDLKQNIFRDDRRDVLASTRAALDYLQRLYGMFGDWHLALASYNWGEGSVGRAIARNQRMGLGTRYEDLNMPNETRNYVPKLQALKNIVTAPHTFNAELPVIDNHPYFQDVEIQRDIDVALAARLADIRLEDFKALNPSANRPIILAAGTGKILLPWDNAEVFKRNLEAHSAGRLASWTAWSVPSTMSVSEAARRAGTSESELRTLNNIPPRMLIKAGSTLVVPRPPHVQADVSDHLADHGNLALAPEVTLRKTTVKARKGDTVELMAKRHKVSGESLAQWNKVATNASFKAGDSVVLFLPARPAANSKAPARKAGSASSKPVPKKAAAQKKPVGQAEKKKAEVKR